MKQESWFPRWSWGAALIAVVFFVWSVGVLDAVKRNRAEADRRAGLIRQLERFHDEAMMLFTSAGPIDLRMRIAVCRTHLAGIKASAAAEPGLDSCLDTMATSLKALDDQGPGKGHLKALFAALDPMLELIRGRNVAIWVEHGRAWESLGALVLASIALLMITATLSWRDTGRRRRAEAHALAARDLVESIRRAQLAYIADPDLPRAFRGLLESLLESTDSRFGFLGEVTVDPDGQSRLTARCLVGLAEADADALFRRVAEAGSPVISRDGSHGTKSFLGLPFRHGEALVGVLVIADRPRGYSRTDIADLEPALTTCSSLIAAHRAENRRVLAEAELRTSKQVAEEANRAKDRFLAVLGHELRTPLTPILAAVTASRDDSEAPTALLELCDMVRRNIEIEVRLIDDLLDVARIGRGMFRMELAVVDAHALIREVMTICRGEVEAAGLRVELSLRAGSHYVEADPARLQQVIWDLVKNAVKFTPAGGTIAVRTRDEREGFDGRAKSPRLVVEVSDTGVGLDPEDLSLIFAPFAQGESSRRGRSGGLGLGLAIGRSVIEAHDGTLRASSPGRDLGATFTIELNTVPAPLNPPSPPLLPAAHQPGPAVPPPAFAAANGRGDGLDILLVEDNKDTLQYLTLLLRQAGHRVRPASTIAGAIEAAAGSIDLVLSDIELPDGNGLDLIRVLHANRPHLPAIAISGFGSDDDARLSFDAGFSDHLTKPVDFRNLTAAIRRVVAQEVAPVVE
jgi:signal transduction histidine kinase/ActR/RegA family two-component response regulator